MEMRTQFYDENLVVQRDSLTLRSPRQEVGVVRNNRHYNEESCGKNRFSHCEVSSSGVGGGDEK